MWARTIDLCVYGVGCYLSIYAAAMFMPEERERMFKSWRRWYAKIIAVVRSSSAVILVACTKVHKPKPVNDDTWPEFPGVIPFIRDAAKEIYTHLIFRPFHNTVTNVNEVGASAISTISAALPFVPAAAVVATIIGFGSVFCMCLISNYEA